MNRSAASKFAVAFARIVAVAADEVAGVVLCVDVDEKVAVEAAEL